MERNITLDPANVMGIYGHNNSNIDLLRNIYPKVKINFTMFKSNPSARNCWG